MVGDGLCEVGDGDGLCEVGDGDGLCEVGDGDADGVFCAVGLAGAQGDDAGTALLCPADALDVGVREPL